MKLLVNKISNYHQLPTLNLERLGERFVVTQVSFFEAACASFLEQIPIPLETLLTTEDDKNLVFTALNSLLPNTYVISQFILNEHFVSCSKGKSVLLICEESADYTLTYCLKIITTPFIEGLLMAEKGLQSSQQKSSEYEALLSVNYEIASLFLDYEDWYGVLTTAFSLVGSYVNVDRIYYFENHKDAATQEDVSSQRFEWVKNDVQPMIDNSSLQNMPLELFQEFMEPLLQSMPFKAIVSQMPDCETKDILSSQDIQSILVLPLIIKGHFFGFIGFDDCQSEREWTSVELNFLKSITSNLASAIYRRNATLEKEHSLVEKKNILESIGDAFFSVDEAWKIIYWNSMATRIFGLTKDEVIGQNLWDFKHFPLTEKIKKRLYQTIENVDSFTFERFYKVKNLWLEINVYSNGTGFSVYIKDITDRKSAQFKLKELNQQLNSKAKELEGINNELEQFAYIASHDLQEPLRMVSSFLQLLEKRYTDLIDETGKKYIAFAVDGALRMRQIISDLLEFSRVGKTKEAQDEVDFSALLTTVVQLYSKSIADNQVTVHVGDMPVFKSWKSPMQQVFMNLLDNAIKYRSPDRPCVVEFSAHQKEGYWQFMVQDNGIGIEAAFYDKIFLIFQRLHTREAYDGSGIGLAVTKKIIEHLGGKIWVTSEHNKGTIFYFTLPN
jgi:PAS domain S-box-containing protein